MTDSVDIEVPILAFGGIVLRGGLRPQIAICDCEEKRPGSCQKGNFIQASGRGLLLGEKSTESRA
jgi:hypothetical protein